MNRFCLVNPLDGRREARDSKRMESAPMAWSEASTPFAADQEQDRRQTCLPEGLSAESAGCEAPRGFSRSE
jgi:hypothetical protein